jgi:hypothetical protein
VAKKFCINSRLSRALFSIACALQVHTEKTPLLIGLRAARANLVPGLVVQAMMIALVAAYYLHPATHDWLELLARAKQRGGFLFTIGASAFAGGVLPELLTIVIFQRGKIYRKNFDNLAFTALFWSAEGMSVDLFYRVQAFFFGSNINFATVMKKLVVDILIYTPFVSVPFTSGCYEWRERGYAFKGLWRVFTVTFYKNKTFPAVIAAWGVWIPILAVVYSLPLLLQFPLFSLALTFWVMLFNFIAARKTKSALPISTPIANPPPP